MFYYVLSCFLFYCVRPNRSLKEHCLRQFWPNHKHAKHLASMGARFGGVRRTSDRGCICGTSGGHLGAVWGTWRCLAGRLLAILPDLELPRGLKTCDNMHVPHSVRSHSETQDNIINRNHNTTQQNIIKHIKTYQKPNKAQQNTIEHNITCCGRWQC